jgi:hypothetical protein
VVTRIIDLIREDTLTMMVVCDGWIATICTCTTSAPTALSPQKRMKRRAAFSSARRFNSYSFVCTSYLSSVPGVPLLSALPLGRACFD